MYHFQGSPCEELEPPLNGAKACETWLVGMHCTVHCNKGYSFAADPKKLYFCTPEGRWVNAKVEGEEKPALPDCSGKWSSVFCHTELDGIVSATGRCNFLIRYSLENFNLKL